MFRVRKEKSLSDMLVDGAVIQVHNQRYILQEFEDRLFCVPEHDMPIKLDDNVIEMKGFFRYTKKTLAVGMKEWNAKIV